MQSIDDIRVRLAGSNDVWISFDSLVNYGIPFKTIESGINRFNKGQTLSYKNTKDPDDKRKTQILFSSIPKTTREKFEIPSIENMLSIADFKEWDKVYQAKLMTKQNKEYEIEKIFDTACENHYLDYTDKYREKLHNNYEKTIKTARKEAIYRTCLQLAEHYKIKTDIHPVALKFAEKYSINIPKSYIRFTTRLKALENTNVATVAHGNIGNKYHNTSVTEFAIVKTQQYYAEPKQLTFESITGLVNKEIDIQREKGENIKNISKSTVFKIASNPEFRNKALKYRDKNLYDKINKAFVRRKRASNVGDLAMMDGTDINIRCWDKGENKVIRVNIFKQMDVCSGKITGFDIQENEDRFNVMDTMKMSATLEGYIPKEIVYDNGSFTKTEEFNELKKQLELKGCYMRAATPGNAKDKSYIERHNETFQTKFQSMIDGYEGEGITSKRSRPSAEHLKKVREVNKKFFKRGVYDYKTLLSYINALICIYNETKIVREGQRLEPNIISRQDTKPNAIKVKSEDVAFLFWNSKTMLVRRSEIETEIRKQTYIYDIWDNDLRNKLNGTQVRMYYDLSDLSEVYLFDLNTGNFIAKVKQKVIVSSAAVSRTDNDNIKIMKQVAHNNKCERDNDKQLNVKVKKLNEVMGDDIFNLLNPFELNKDKLKTAESIAMSNYFNEKNEIDPNTVVMPPPVIDPTPLNTKEFGEKKKVMNENIYTTPGTLKVSKLPVNTEF